MEQKRDTQKITRTAPSAKRPPVDRRTAVRRRPSDKDPAEINITNILMIIFFPVSFIYYEFLVHASLFGFGDIFGSFFAYAVLFGISAGLVVSLICTAFPQKVNYWVSVGILLVVTVYFGVQLVYCSFFKDFFYWGLLEVGGQIAVFWRETLAAIWKNIIPILLLFVPPAVFALIGRKAVKPLPLSWLKRGVCAALSLVFFLFGIGFVNLHKDPMGDRYVYNEGFMMSEAASRFGLFTALRLDTKYTLFGNRTDSGIDPPSTVVTQDWREIFGTGTGKESGTGAPAPGTEAPGTTGIGGETSPVPTGDTEPVITEPPVVIDTSPNVMDIDFESLIASAKNNDLKNAHTWFSNRAPTNKNEYTGIFKGKNLIFITVEAWAPAAIDKNFTPTLWKMKNEGFVFDNYFCSMWGASTNTGEYANITGNFYNALALYKSSKTYEPFTLGNQLKKLGYRCCAFHNGEYTYYGREDSHPNYGYEWYGIKSLTVSGRYEGSAGWNVTFEHGWPASDKEMADNTLSFIPSDGKPFHIYYMTISGHPNETFTGNMQAKRHKAEVMAAGLPYTDENALAYVAAEYEVELMVSTLIEDLKAKGIYEDTVFVMAPDHYPYAISPNDDNNVVTLSQLYGIDDRTTGIFTNYNLYRAPLIIWSPSMKAPVKVSKVCSAIDILPTVSNLFGLEFDSRIIMGRDILSDAEGFVILNMSNSGSIASSYNWITDYGYFSNASKQFTPFPGINVDENALKSSGYLTYHSNLVNEMYKYSKYILNNDYYGKVFPNR